MQSGLKIEKTRKGFREIEALFINFVTERKNFAKKGKFFRFSIEISGYLLYNRYSQKKYFF